MALAIIHNKDQVVELTNINSDPTDIRRANTPAYVTHVIISSAAGGEFRVRLNSVVYSFRNSVEHPTIEFTVDRVVSEVELVASPLNATVYLFLADRY